MKDINFRNKDNYKKMKNKIRDFEVKMRLLRDENKNLKRLLEASNKEVVARGYWGIGLDKEIEVLRSQISSNRNEIHQLNEEIVARGHWGKGLDEEVLRLKEIIDLDEKRLDIYQGSKVLWLLSPFLHIEYLIKNRFNKKSLSTATLSVLKVLYKFIPISVVRKNNIKWFIYTKFGIFSQSPSYIAWKKQKDIYESYKDKPEGENISNLGDIVSKTPLVSIIIPVYGNVEYTLMCLSSISKVKESIKHEIIVVDDCSPDNTVGLVSKINGIKLLVNKQNKGFIRSCNAGAQIAKGQYLHFLNNDTEVKDYWLTHLVDTFASYKKAGMVGSKLVYPTGQLQEAGGIIWNDASGWNFGRLSDPNEPKYSFARRVDYCSGAAILISKNLFNEIGGFDERYVPAYYEDSDLAFEVRNRKLDVVYQPLSVVTHYEGISSGTDLGSGTKAYQVTNQKKFKEKWRDELSRLAPNGHNPIVECDHYVRGRILIVDACTPTPDMDAGSVTAFFFMKIFVDLGYHVTFVPADNFLNMDRYTADLQKIGVQCIYAPYFSNLDAYLVEEGLYFDYVLLYRVGYASMFYDSVKKYCPQAKIIFDTVDLHYLRMERQAHLQDDKSLLLESKEVKKKEIKLINDTDATIVLSEQEVSILADYVEKEKLYVVPLILEIPGRKKSFKERQGIFFIGGYQHVPNIDAVKYFVESIWPLIHKKVPEMIFYILGSQPTEEILAINAPGVEVIGFVENLSEYMDECRLSVVPLRFGAGIKGKIGSSMSYGVPSVSTAIGVEGMKINEGDGVLVAEDEAQFAEKVIELYLSEEKWTDVSNKGLEFVESMYSMNAGAKKLNKLLNDLGS